MNEPFNPEVFATDVMNYAIAKAKHLTSAQYAEAFNELTNAAQAEYAEAELVASGDITKI